MSDLAIETFKDFKKGQLYLINSKKISSPTVKKNQTCYFGPWKGQPGNSY